MNSLTKFFLILLRLAIGWHLLFAGIEKFEPKYKGSEGYLQNSGGPLAPMFHWMAGDRLADKLAVVPLPSNTDSAKVPLHNRFPPALDQEWNDYFAAFAAHYHLTPAQQDAARGKMEQVEDKATDWMLNQQATISKTSPYGPPTEMSKTVSDWVQEYQRKRQKLWDEAASQYHLGVLPLADNTRDQSADKAEVAKIRGDLTKELDKYNKDMKDALRSVLTDEQEKMPPLAGPVKPTWQHMTRMDWIDFQVRWGLVVVGVCLLAGFLTRLSCLGGAALLLMFYLAVPPLPGLPEAFGAEGHPFINKNIVEMLALLTLATTCSGRWAGIDGLLYYLNPFRRKTPRPQPTAPIRPEALAPHQVTATESSRVPVEAHAPPQVKS